MSTQNKSRGGVGVQKRFSPDVVTDKSEVNGAVEFAAAT